MERLISLFKHPDEFEFADAADENYPYPWLDQPPGEAPGDVEPEYFRQLMQYLRERNEPAPCREGAD